MKSLVDILEIPLILNRIQSNCRTVIGKQLILHSDFIPFESIIEKNQEVDQMMTLISRYQVLPIGHSQDLNPLLDRLEKGSIIDISGLLAIQLDLQTIQHLLHHIKSIRTPLPLLEKIWQGFNPLTSLRHQFEQTLNPQGLIQDQASPGLASVRKRLLAMHQLMMSAIQKAVNQYGSVLTEPIFTIKNGHYVLPVSTSSKSSVPGIVHDVSSTGLTTFVEPKALVDLTLEHQMLLGEEQEEIIKILQALTDLILPMVDRIRLNNALLAYLDLIQAKASFGIQHQGYVGQLSPSPIIDIQGARHPLIEPGVVVANDFLLTEKKHIIIISGPNAGGKTVAMKTVGLFVYLHQLAIPLPTKQPAQLAYFKQIFADIGDQQSVLENLSTFAGHIKQLVPLTDQVKPFDLVLIDELGTGTDPKEGESLARSLLIHLQAKRAFVIVSSHFPGLKTLALQEPRMINASLQFDENLLMPTYRFILGLPGKSYGLIMAKRYGLAPQVVTHAEQYLAEQQQSLDQQSLIKLQQQLQEVEALKIALSEEKNQLLSQQKSLKQTQTQLQQKLQQLQNQAEQQQLQILAETMEKVDVTIKALANPNLKLHEAISLKQQLQPVDTPLANPSFNSIDLAVGDYVIETSTGLTGRVTSINKQQVMIITSDSLTVKVKLGQLEKTSPPKAQPSKPVRLIRSSKAPSSLNIIGMRYEAAKEAVEKYYDQAILSGLKTLKIIHGFGSGTLRQMVWDYFKNIPQVQKIQQGEGEQSGYGVTIIHL
jgi:DNA mismatch repair protein MutS2